MAKLELGSVVIYGGIHTKVVGLFDQPTAVLENDKRERVTVAQSVLNWHTVTPPAMQTKEQSGE